MKLQPQSKTANENFLLVCDLQSHFAARLSQAVGVDNAFSKVEWLRDDGKHGGGHRMVASHPAFNRGSINVSQVHYDDLADKPLGSANALSTIIHPANPHAPSMHMHISWTEMKDGRGYWRIMADLNPSIERQRFKARFDQALADVAGSLYQEASDQGDRYFYIPALERHRGVSHFYLEQYSTDDAVADRDLARNVGESVINTYGDIFAEIFATNPDISDQERDEQLAYHTLYLFQVLTLDRGTTSGLLVHDQNDVGIMGSIPAHVNRDLLSSWRGKVEAPQDALIDRILDALPASVPTPVEDDTKAKLARAVREHYRANPKALEMQAKGNVLPPTVANHLGD